MLGADGGAGVAHPGGGSGPGSALRLAEALARRAKELRAPLAAPAPPRAGAGAGAGAGAPPDPQPPPDLVALAEATRAGLSRVKARCLDLAEALVRLEARAAPMAGLEGRARAGIGAAAAGLQAAAISREEAHAAELAEVRERRAQLLLRGAGGAGAGPAAAPRPSTSEEAPGPPRGDGGGAGPGGVPGEGQVAQAAEALRRALEGRSAGGDGRALGEVKLEFKLDRDFNVKDVWEAEDSGAG